MKKIWPFFQRRHRAVTAVLLVLLGLVACVIVVGFIPFSNTMLKNRAQQLLTESLSGSWTIDKLNVTLWKGVILSNVRYRSYDQENGALRVSFAFPRMTLSYYLIPLLFKHLIINNISFEKPDVSIEFPPPDAKKEKQANAFSFAALSRVIATLPYTVLVKNISIVNAHVTAVQNDRAIINGKGLSFSMKVGLIRGLTLEGRLSAADMMLFGNCRLTGLKASIRVKGTSVSLYDCRAAFYGGTLSIKGSADLSEGMMQSLTMTLTGLKLNEWRREAVKGPGDLNGNVDAFLALEPSKLSADSLKGKGWIKATAVTTYGTALQKNLMLRLVIPKLSTLRFNKIYTDLLIKKGKIYTRNFYGKGDPIDFTADGWAGMNGLFSERIEGVFSADFSKCLPQIVQNSLLPVPGDKERRSFKCTVEGKFDHPQLSVDQKIVNRAVNNIFNEIGKGLGNLFRK